MSENLGNRDWKAAYIRLLSDYQELERKYNDLSNEHSWTVNPDRSGGQFDYRDRSNDGGDREYPDWDPPRR